MPRAKNDRYFEVVLVAILGGAYPIVHYILYTLHICLGGTSGNYGRGVPRRARIQLWLWWGENFSFVHPQDLIPKYIYSLSVFGWCHYGPKPPIQYIRSQPMRNGHVKDYSFKKPIFFKPDIHSIQITGPESMFMNKTICWSLESESDYHISAVWEMLTSAGELQGRINPRIICIRRILINIRRIFNVSYTSWRKIYFFL